MSNDLQSVFRESTEEFLVELEQALLQLNKNPDDTAEIDRIFRVMHTIKGSAAMVDFDDVAHFAHRLESECDYFRQGKAMVTPEIIHLALCAHDCLSSLIASHYGGSPADSEHVNGILDKFSVARQQAMLQSGSDAYGYERTARLLRSIIKDLSGRTASNEQSIAQAGKKITELYYLLLIQDRETIVEFLSKLEQVFRRARIEKQVLSDSLLELAVEMLREAEDLYNESEEISEADFDPEAIMQAIQRPLELNARLVELSADLQQTTTSLPVMPVAYKICITALERGPGALSSSERFAKVLNHIGRAPTANSSAPAKNKPVLLAKESAA